MRVYGFLRSPRWIGLGLLMTLLAVVMVGLGLWQLDRYHLRSAINARIDAGTSASPVPIASVLTPPAPSSAGPSSVGAAPAEPSSAGPSSAGPSSAAPALFPVGPAPSASVLWTRVTVTGTYDPAHQILARARTVGENVGFEVLTPLVLADGTAVLIDRGWIPPSGTATAAPAVPPAPSGPVTVTGRVHAPESRAGAPEPFAGGLAVRRIAPAALASAVPHPLYGAYVTMDSQSPPPDPLFVQIPADHENAAMNAGYVVQWWMLALLTLAGFGYLVIREARPPGAPFDPDPPSDTAPSDTAPSGTAPSGGPLVPHPAR